MKTTLFLLLLGLMGGVTAQKKLTRNQILKTMNKGLFDKLSPGQMQQKSNEARSSGAVAVRLVNDRSLDVSKFLSNTTAGVCGLTSTAPHAVHIDVPTAQPLLPLLPDKQRVRSPQARLLKFSSGGRRAGCFGIRISRFLAVLWGFIPLILQERRLRGSFKGILLFASVLKRKKVST